jgi:threonine dehydrogenase-like Zn-dependent dehydrogenase
MLSAPAAPLNPLQRNRLMARKRRAAAINDKGIAVVIEEAAPDVLPGQIMVRVHAASISPGTEMDAVRYARGDGPRKPGRLWRMGYQNAGDVAAVGEGVTQFRKGDRVTCFGAGYAYITDLAVVPQNLCCKLPDDVSFEEGAFGNLVLTGQHALRRAKPTMGERLLVVGMGLVGQLTAQYGRIAGLDVMGWDTFDSRLRIAKKCGIHGTVNVTKADSQAAARAFTDGQGFDISVLALGGDGDKAFNAARDVMQLSPDGHREGRMVMVGGLTVKMQGGAGTGNLNILGAARTGPGYHDEAWEHGRADYPPVFMRWTTRTNMEWALRLMQRGELKIKPLITHRMPLNDFVTAIDLLMDKPDKAMGVVFSM